MKHIKRNNLKYFMALFFGLSLLLQTSVAISAQAPKKVSETKILPGQTTTTVTTPLPSTTPSMNYQRPKKPAVQRLDIPEYDIAGDLKNVKIEKYGSLGKRNRRLKYKIAFINKGTHRNSNNVNIPFKIRIINILDQTLLKEERNFYRIDLRNDYWMLSQEIITEFNLIGSTARDQNDLKVILDIDPNNTFHEAQRYRGNNRCVHTW